MISPPPIFTTRMPKDRCLVVLARIERWVSAMFLPSKYALALDVAIRAVSAANPESIEPPTPGVPPWRNQP